MKITQIPMGAHNAQLTCYLQDPCTEMPALDRCPAILIFPAEPMLSAQTGKPILWRWPS